MKKIVLVFTLLLSVLYAKDEQEIVVAGPIASVSHPIFYMIENDVLKDLNKKIKFKLWNNPDELKALILNKDVDFVVLPSTVAANLYNKGVDLQLVNISVWGTLQMISRDKNLKKIEDFKGKKIAVPFRANMPDIVLQTLIKQAGFDVKKDFDIQYMATPIEALQMLILRKVDHALLVEPMVSIALRKTGSFPTKAIAPDLYRSVSLKDEYRRLFKTKNKIPQGGIAVIGKSDDKKELINRFLLEYDKALKWYKANNKEASKIVVKFLPMLDQEGLADAISHIDFESKLAIDVQKELEFFFKILEENDKRLIGGKIPDKGLYYK